MIYSAAQYQCLALINLKDQGCDQAFCLHDDLHFLFQQDHFQTCFELLTPFQYRGCVNVENICLYGVLYFIAVNLISENKY